MTGQDQHPDDELLTEMQGGVCLVTMNRPHAFNAADAALHGRLAAVWSELGSDPADRAIVLTGSGRAFSGGGDLDLLEQMTEQLDLRKRIMAEAADIVRSMTSVGVPIVSAVNGPAVGLGCSLAAMSDLVVVEEQAYFADPHVTLGLVAADGGALTWPLLTSLLRAKEHLLLGDRLSANDAVALGLANRMVPQGESVAVALNLAGRLAALPPQAVRETKSLLNTVLRSVIDSALPTAIATESDSFDQPEFRANLESMLSRGRST